MKLEPAANPNYAAVVCRLPKLLILDGCDRLQGAPLLGFQAVIGLEHQPGELGVVFPAETQLSESFCRENNLYRHQEANKNHDAKGYLEDSRRVRAIKLRGHRSDCLWLPLESLAHTRAKLDELVAGDCFDSLNGVELCRKYVIRTKGPSTTAPQEKKFIRVDPRLFPEHPSIGSYFREGDMIPQDAWVSVSQKLHGTSVRLGHTLVLRQLTIRERIAKRLGVKVDATEWDTIAGSRKVVKDPKESPNAQHFYDSDIWSQHLDRVEHLIPEGYMIFGEICGHTREGAEIQKDYSYGIDDSELFVYRVAFINTRGVSMDLSWPQVRQWCKERELKTVPDLWQGYHRDFVVDDWLDKRFADEGYPDALPLGKNKKLVDEGICIRWDGLTPTVKKAKSSAFTLHETKLLDAEIVDIESIESEDAA